METKELTATGGMRTEERTGVMDAVRGWLRSECRWATRLTQRATGTQAVTTNGALLGEANMAASMALTCALIESLTLTGMAVMMLWTAVSWSLMKKGGRK